MKILLVEDEPKLLYSISKGLRENAFQVNTMQYFSLFLTFSKRDMLSALTCWSTK